MDPRPPSISHRTSIRFLPNPPTEPTDTLVLNGGGTTNLFTDFRPLHSDPTKCEWAFAGVKKYYEDGRCQWDHFVDYRAVEGGVEAAPDVGHCEILEDGSEVERGEMVNPESGKVEAYEEVWRDEQVPSGSRIVVLQLRPTVGRDASSDPELETRGIFILVGQWAQVVMRGVKGVSADRWHFSGRWKTVKSYGDHTQAVPFPAGDALDKTTIDIPAIDEFEGSRWEWQTVDDYAWNP